MKRLVLFLVVLFVPVAVLAQGMLEFSGVAYCVCRYDCVDAGAGQRIKAACTNLVDGGVCYYPAASLCRNGVCSAGATFSFEGPCTTGPTVYSAGANSGYASAQGCAASACYYNADGGQCGSTPF